ncbi:Uncharacterised protein [Vibrio cholerae]|nr:Uncharacterised protein [Vibrio cholerae]CSI66871.1 Uncharacterised protein [Vibrio cholerae]
MPLASTDSLNVTATPPDVIPATESVRLSKR